MWTVYEAKGLDRDLAKMPRQVVEKYEFWKNVVRHSGPQGLRTIRGFNDEALKGKWAGFRSSRLNEAYRVIYQAETSTVSVFVERVSKHDYR